jgi:hypothetical protein
MTAFSKKAATTLTDAVKNCSPRPLTQQNLADFWVDTQDARDGLVCFRDNLKDILDQEGEQKVLVYGHRGCGKSTEINKFISGLDESWLVVKLNAGDYLPVSGNQAADVLLAACTRLIDVAKERKLELNESSMQPVLEYFTETTKNQTYSSEAALGMEAGVDSSHSVIGKLLGLKAKLVSALKFGARSETSTIECVRKRKGELSAAIYALTQAAEMAWREKSGYPFGRLLLVIEELDKLGLDDARKIFIEDGRLLSEVGIRAIYTIPIFAFHSADAGAIRSFFEHEQRFPMIKVVTPEGEVANQGREIVSDIVRRRVGPGILPDDALDVLIERTGGVLRDVFEAIQTTAQFRKVRECGILDRDSVEEALRRMETSIGLQIAYPPDDRGVSKDPKPLQEKLAELARKQAAGKRIITQPDPELQLLLMSGALLEYNGDGWLGVHPLARAYLKDLEYVVDA